MPVISSGILADDDVVVTGSGLLFCNNIIHVVGQRDPALITTLVENVLEECENKGFSTISFPALGTGRNSQSRNNEYSFVNFCFLFHPFPGEGDMY